MRAVPFGESSSRSRGRRESGSFKRYEFVRNSMSGIQILRDEVVRPTPSQAAAS